ncbi:hypothetical protein [Actinacidiphila sp. bgisy160]|uniref:hypothetical protein n=1 Tax=Actinacidiphila sp. bgisy160 TaxID=3413796 RepID=UPI003D73900D
MHRHRRPFTAAVAVAAACLAALLGACAGPDSGAVAGSGPSAAATAGAPAAKADPRVIGLLDDHRHVARRTATGRRPHMVQRCTDRTRRVKHSSSSGSGKRRSTRTWYTTEHYKDCRKVRQGTESYTRVVSAERWCVELDDVGGDRTRDDVWFTVDSATYDTAVDTKEGTPTSFTPLATGC